MSTVNNQETNDKENNKDISPDITDKYSFLKDVSLFLAFLTGLSYFLSLAFNKGQNDFYGIDELVKTQLDINILLNSFYSITSLLLKLCTFYIVGKVLLFLLEVWYKYRKHDDETRKGSLIIISKFHLIGFIILVFPFYIIGAYETPADIFFNLGLLFRLFITFTILTILLSLIPKVQPVAERFLQLMEKENLTLHLWENSKTVTRVILILIVSLGLSVVFYNYGYTVAEQKDKYMIYSEEVLDPNTNKKISKDYVLLNKDGKTLILSELKNAKNGFYINKDDIKMLELKSGQANFRNQDIKKGLQVIPNKREEKLKGFLDFWNKYLTGNP